MTKYVPTDDQRAAFNTDHSTRATAESIVRMIATGRGIDRALIRNYVSHDVDTTGVCDTVGVFYVDVFAAGKNVRGYAEIAFNVLDGVPIAADFRDFHPVMKAV